jgi:hypothetical protein
VFRVCLHCGSVMSTLIPRDPGFDLHVRDD